MRYTWPRRSAVVLSFDFDAESGFLYREPEQATRSLADLEVCRFGPRVGVDRILRLLDRPKLTCHPFIRGRASRVQLIEDLVRSVRRQRGVWFTTCEEVARWHEKNR